MWINKVIDVEVDGKTSQVFYSAKWFEIPSEYGMKKKRGQKLGHISKLQVFLIDKSTPYSAIKAEKKWNELEKNTDAEPNSIVWEFMPTEALLTGLKMKPIAEYDRGWVTKATSDVAKEAVRMILSVLG